MNFELKKEDWARFFDNLSKRRFEWMTEVEVLGANVGDQTLSNGLPLNGITVEVVGGYRRRSNSGANHINASIIFSSSIARTSLIFISPVILISASLIYNLILFWPLHRPRNVTQVTNAMIFVVSIPPS